MSISTKGRYAVRAMLELALRAGEGPTLIKDICERQGLSNLYLEQLFGRLKTAGLVRSLRGPSGGFMLAKSPSEIRLIDIVQTMDGSSAPVDCVDNIEACPRSGSCVARGVWSDVKKAVDTVLASSTLEDLAKQEKQNRATSTETDKG